MTQYLDLRKYKEQIRAAKQSDLVIISDTDAYTSNLNAQQQQAFRGIIAWVLAGTACDDESKARDPQYSSLAGLFGFAGTGKTYTLQRIAEYLKKHKKRICFTAPTHKAVQVLKKMSTDISLSVDCMTIHKLLGLTIERNHDGRQVLVPSGNDGSYKYDLVVIDECSMVNLALFDHIPKRTDTKFLFVGDPCQLPPVEGKEEDPSPIASLSPTFTSVPIHWSLTDVVRNDGAILNYCTDIRNNITQKRLPRKSFALDKFEGASTNDWHNRLIKAVKAAQSPDEVRALAWSNNRIQSLNQDIRAAIFGENVPQYQAGERLVAKDLIEASFDDNALTFDPDYEKPTVYGRDDDQKWNTGSPSVLMYSCAECTVQRATLKTISGWNVWELEILTDLGDRAIVNAVDDSEKEKVKKHFGAWKKSIIAMPNQTDRERKARKAEWAKFYTQMHWLGITAKGNGFMRQLQYAFALTIHQSQGSTFEKVFSDESNVYGCQDATLRNQLLYVAASRASQELYLHCRFME